MARLHRILDGYLAFKHRFSRRPPGRRGMLLISAGGLGDTVLFALVLERFMELARDGEDVTVLLRRDAAKMAFLFPPEVAVRAVDFSRLQRSLGYRRDILESLHRARFRLVVATDHLRHPHLDEALVAAADAAQAVAMEPRPWPKHDKALRANRRLYSRLWDSGPTHVDKVVRWAAFADWLTGTWVPPPKVRLAGDRLPAPAAADGPFVVIQPFSAVKEKQSPPELIERIIRSLPEGARAVITGAPQDLERNPEFRPLLAMPGVSFDDSAFEALVPLLRAATAVVSVDTALMHLAVAVGAPTVCLASAAYAGEIVPYDPAITPDNARFVFQPMDCQGCLGTCSLPAERGMYPCVARLGDASGIERIFAAIQEVMAPAKFHS